MNQPIGYICYKITQTHKVRLPIGMAMVPSRIEVTFGQPHTVPADFVRDGLTYCICRAKFVSHRRVKATYSLKGFNPNASDGLTTS